MTDAEIQALYDARNSERPLNVTKAVMVAIGDRSFVRDGKDNWHECSTEEGKWWRTPPSERMRVGLRHPDGSGPDGAIDGP